MIMSELTVKLIHKNVFSILQNYLLLLDCEFRALDIPKAQIEKETLFQNIADEKACARKCQKYVECEFFVYVGPDHPEETWRKNCVLKDGIGNAEVVEGPGLLSSYRTCKFP